MHSLPIFPLSKINVMNLFNSKLHTHSNPIKQIFNKDYKEFLALIYMALEKEDIVLTAQLLQNMKELAEKLEEDYLNKDVIGFNAVKKEILKISKKLGEIL